MSWDRTTHGPITSQNGTCSNQITEWHTLLSQHRTTHSPIRSQNGTCSNQITELHTVQSHHRTAHAPIRSQNGTHSYHNAELHTVQSNHGMAHASIRSQKIYRRVNECLFHTVLFSLWRSSVVARRERASWSWGRTLPTIWEWIVVARSDWHFTATTDDSESVDLESCISESICRIALGFRETVR